MVSFGKELDFSVQALIPDNQIDKEQTYFDLKLIPGQTQIVQVKIVNSSAQDFTAHLKLNSATTARNGLIDYKQWEEQERDESLKYSINEIAKIEKEELNIPANSSVLANIQIDMPDEKIAGIILGGIVISTDIAQEDDTENTGIQIQNKYDYVIGMKLMQSDEEVLPELYFKGVDTGLVNYRPAVSFRLQNDQPVIIKNMNIQADVFQKGKDEVLYQLQLDQAEMAPNSNGDFVIEWGNTPIKAGNYILKVRAEHEGRIWEWEESFEITAQSANETNQNAVGIEKSNIWIYIISGFTALLFLILLAFWFGRKSVRDKEEGQQ